MQRLSIGLLLLICAHTVALTPFELEMQAIQYGFIDIKADGRLSVSQTDDAWVARLDARAAIGRQQEQANFDWHNQQIVPERYTALTRLTLVKEQKQYQFSPQWIEGSVNGEPFRVANQQTFDPLTSMLHMSQQLQAGKQSWQQQSITWNRSKAERYQVVRQGIMNTALGKLRVSLVQQTDGQRSNENNYYWFADDYGFIPVRWRREVDNKITYEVLLQSGSFNGEPIVGQ